MENSAEQYKEALQTYETKLKKKADDINRNSTDAQQLVTRNETSRISLEAMTIKCKNVEQERDQMRLTFFLFSLLNSFYYINGIY